MKRKLYSAGAVLSILLVGAFVFLIVQEQATLQKMREEARAAQSLLDKWLAEREATPKNKQQAAPMEGNDAAEQKQSADETQGTAYEWQKLSGRELLKSVLEMRPVDVDALPPEERAALEQDVLAAFDALSPAEQEAVKQDARAAYWASEGLAPPPPGYTYGQNQDGYYLVKYGEPHIRINWDRYKYGNDHLLSDTEWEEYKALGAIKDAEIGPARLSQTTPEAIALAKDWYDALREKTWGPVPRLNSTVRWGGKMPTQAEQDRVDQIVRDTYHSLIPTPRSGVIDYNVVDRLLAELQTELERR